MTQEEFYQSKAWKRTKRAFISERIRIDGGVCQVCGRRLGKIVHHIEWLDDIKCNIPSIALNHKNLRYECQTCHNRERDPRQSNGRGRVVYGADGEVYERG